MGTPSERLEAILARGDVTRVLLSTLNDPQRAAINAAYFIHPNALGRMPYYKTWKEMPECTKWLDEAWADLGCDEHAEPAKPASGDLLARWREVVEHDSVRDRLKKESPLWVEQGREFMQRVVRETQEKFYVFSRPIKQSEVVDVGNIRWRLRGQNYNNMLFMILTARSEGPGFKWKHEDGRQLVSSEFQTTVTSFIDRGLPGTTFAGSYDEFGGRIYMREPGAPHIFFMASTSSDFKRGMTILREFGI